MSHRDGFAPDVGGLGPKVESPAPAKPAIPSKPDERDIVRGSDGKLHTQIPGNEKANLPPYPYIYIFMAERDAAMRQAGADILGRQISAKKEAHR